MSYVLGAQGYWYCFAMIDNYILTVTGYNVDVLWGNGKYMVQRHAALTDWWNRLYDKNAIYSVL